MDTLVKNPMAHSHSRLTTFSSCPLAYRLQFIDKVPTEDSDAMEIGSAAHEFFDQWVKFTQKSPVMGPSTIDELAAKCFQKEARNQDNFKDYLGICQIFAEEYKPDPAYPVVIAERQVAFDRHWKECNWFDKAVMFRAKIDRIELPAGDAPKKIRITDYKTGYSGAINTFQLDIYALVASLLYPGLEQVEIQFYYVKSGFKQVKTLEVKDLDVTKMQLEALMARVEGESKFKAKPGAKCLNCPVAASCTAKPSNLVALTSMEQAQTLGEEVAFLEAQAKAKKKALNAYCRTNGAVEAGGLVYNHYPVESLVVQIAPFLSACVSYNQDPQDLLNPDSTAIKKACKKVPGFSDAIAPYVGVDVSTRFLAKKKEEDEE
jgi:CRISPR/Cas system-associated exonuclease Cas4 (RecB family)